MTGPMQGHGSFLVRKREPRHIVAVRTLADQLAADGSAPNRDGVPGCDHPQCQAAGLYRAPKARDRLREYYRFCLEHVRAYNIAWNYCAGFTEADIEAQIRSAACWDRPTWRLGHWQGLRTEAGTAAQSAGFRAGSHGETRDKRSRRRAGEFGPDDANASALAVLGLDSAATLSEIKARYKRLVKRYHPDANGGDKQAEERLKTINQAYTTLRMRASA